MYACVSVQCGAFLALFTCREKERGGKSEDGEELLYHPPPPAAVAARSSTGEPRRRGKTVVDVTVGTQRSLEGGEKILKTIEVCGVFRI